MAQGIERVTKKWAFPGSLEALAKALIPLFCCFANIPSTGILRQLAWGLATQATGAEDAQDKPQAQQAGGAKKQLAQPEDLKAVGLRQEDGGTEGSSGSGCAVPPAGSRKRAG